MFANPCPAEELYRVSKNPDQFTNLAGNPEYAETINQARGLLKNWTEQTGDTIPENPTPHRHSPPRVENGKVIPSGKRGKRTGPRPKMPGAAKNAGAINHSGQILLAN